MMTDAQLSILTTDTPPAVVTTFTPEQADAFETAVQLLSTIYQSLMHTWYDQKGYTCCGPLLEFAQSVKQLEYSAKSTTVTIQERR